MQFIELLHIEQLGVSAADERGMCRGGNVAHLLGKSNISWRTANLIIANQHAVRLATKGSVLLLVDDLEQRALIEFNGLVEVFIKLFKGRIKDANFERTTGLSVHHQVIQPTPRCFECLQLFVVQNVVQLATDRAIY